MKIVFVHDVVRMVLPAAATAATIGEKAALGRGEKAEESEVGRKTELDRM